MHGLVFALRHLPSRTSMRKRTIFTARYTVTNCSCLKTRSAGFTLLEVLTVCVIVGILAAIALPSYGDYVKRGQIQDGTTALSDARVKLEQHFQDNKTYETAGAVVSPCPAPTQFFTYNCAPLPTTFVLTAAGKDNLTGFNYTIDQSAARTSTTPWSGGAPVNCWIIKKGDTC
jgi:type IV pilus assembly protein PilE